MAAYVCINCERPEEDCEEANTCGADQRLVKMNDLQKEYREARKLLEDVAVACIMYEDPNEIASKIDAWLKATAPVCYALPKGIYNRNNPLG